MTNDVIEALKMALRARDPRAKIDLRLEVRKSSVRIKGTIGWGESLALLLSPLLTT